MEEQKTFTCSYAGFYVKKLIERALQVKPGQSLTKRRLGFGSDVWKVSMLENWSRTRNHFGLCLTRSLWYHVFHISEYRHVKNKAQAGFIIFEPLIDFNCRRRACASKQKKKKKKKSLPACPVWTPLGKRVFKNLCSARSSNACHMLRLDVDKNRMASCQKIM